MKKDIIFTSILIYLKRISALEVLVDESGQTSVKNEVDSFSLGYVFGPTTRKAIELKPWSVLNTLFPDTVNSIESGWENVPLYLPTHVSLDQNETSRTTSIKTLETDDDTASSDRFSNIFSSNDVMSVLRDPKLVHGKDYLVLKYLLRDGEEWNGQLPYDNIPPEHIPIYLQNKEFSLVINDMQKRWKTVKDIARSLETEINPYGVSCNLYLTPPRASRAFESHLDWMDVIVFQIEGEKEWSVWNSDPFVKLAPPDRKRKPKMAELSKKGFENVRMKPGDALYIPRGHLHNATTPADSDKMSLHLTFGIEYDFFASIEALLHNALNLFSKGNKNAMSVAITSRICGSTMTYEKFLHYAISTMVRETNCGGFGEMGLLSFSKDEDRNTICDLRKSIPLHPQWKELKGRTDADIKNTYVRALDVISREASARSTLEFANNVSMDNLSDGKSLGSSSFKYPGLSGTNPYNCNLDAKEVSGKFQDRLHQISEEFMKFAKGNFESARNELLNEIESTRKFRWKEDDRHLTEALAGLA